MQTVHVEDMHYWSAATEAAGTLDYAGKCRLLAIRQVLENNNLLKKSNYDLNIEV